MKNGDKNDENTQNFNNKNISKEITQKSDLFGFEILLECILDNEYGKLNIDMLLFLISPLMKMDKFA